MKRPELLAPAGGWDALVAAVQNGADAVYLGGRLFNARRSADNFGPDRMAEAIEYAHVRGVKVYVTVNILLADTELRDAVRFLHFIYNAGADAAIVQDLGLVRLARQVIPELALHASTQMTAHNLPGVEFLRDAGVKRVVLSRELDLDAVRNIRKRSGIEVETFVHGALCVCYSGQCLMSSIIGGRSGNRGRCAQPCRLEYRLVDEKGRQVVDPAGVGEYLLSPRDLNLCEHIPLLIDAGIDSFKIEGRMRRPEYVATVVRIYRELIDRATSGERFKVTEEEKVELAQAFNRGFTTGYYFGNPGRDLMSYKRPNNRGILLGRVKKYNQRTKRALIALEAPLSTGDGIEVWVSRGGRAGTEVRDLWLNGRKTEDARAGETVEVELEGYLKPGDRVFKTHDTKLMNRAMQSYASSREILGIPLDMKVRAKVGKPLTIEACDREGNRVEVHTRVPGALAQKRPLTAEFVAGQLGRLGNTPFALGRLECFIEGEVMVPVSEINDARRRLVEMMFRKRSLARRPEPLSAGQVEKKLLFFLNNTPATPARVFPRLAVAVSDPASVRAAVDCGADIVYFASDGFCHRGKPGMDEMRKARRLCRAAKVSFIPLTPRILHDRELVPYQRELKLVLEMEPDGIMAANYGLLPLLREAAPGLPLAVDFPLNVFNRQSVLFLAERGISRVTLSPELTGEQIRELVTGVNVETEIIVHGRLPLMVSRYCAPGSLLGGKKQDGKCNSSCRKGKYALLDRKGVIFPLGTDKYCLMHVFNSRELCLMEALPELVDEGPAVLRVEARRESEHYVIKTVRAYRKILDMIKRGTRKLPDLEKMARDLTSEGSGYTRGHFYRGVMD